jgi:hypothetical protein
MMAGELWRSYFQIGKETTPGTGVPATRKMYFDKDNSGFTKEQPPRPKKFATGTRDNVRAFTLGNTVVGGKVQMPLSASEIIELLLMTVAGGVTPTGAGVTKLWTFTPGETLDPATIEWQDGARAWEANGVYGNTLKIEGSVEGEAMVTSDLFGLSLASTTMTGALTDRTPDFIEGWETALYIDAIGGTPGTTQVSDTLINWSIELNNQLERKYFAQNTKDAGGVTIGEIELKATLLFEAAASAALTEFDNWNAATQRLVRFEFGQNEVIDGSDKKFVTVDMPGAWDALNLGSTDKNTRAYEMSLQYVYDVTNGYGLQIRAQNDRSAAWV